jgi:hypothetical protein
MNTKQWFRKWLLSDAKVSASETIAGNRLSEEDALLTFNIIKATNGYIIKASQYKPQQRGPDWLHHLYIVKDDEKIPDVIARIMAINALEK